MQLRLLDSKFVAKKFGQNGLKVLPKRRAQKLNNASGSTERLFGQHSSIRRLLKRHVNSVGSIGPSLMKSAIQEKFLLPRIFAPGGNLTSSRIRHMSIPLLTELHTSSLIVCHSVPVCG